MDLDDEVIRFMEATELQKANLPLEDLYGKVTQFNQQTRRNDIFVPLQSGGFTKVGEEDLPQPEVMADAPMQPEIQQEVSAQPAETPDDRFARMQQSTKEYAAQPGAFDEFVPEVAKGMARGGFIRPAQFLKDNFDVYDPLALQIVDPKTGEFAPKLLILSRQEKEQLDAQMQAGELPYAFDVEQLLETSEQAGSMSEMAGSMAQFIGAFAGLGKLFSIGKGTVGLATRAASADFLAFKGDEGRITDLLLEMGVPENQVTNFLRTDPNDLDYVGRFKTALEGAALGVVADGTIRAIGKTFRSIKDGDVLAEELDAAVKEGNAGLKGIMQTVVDRINQPGQMPTVSSFGVGALPPGQVPQKLEIRSQGGLPIAQEKGDENLRLHLQRLTKMQETGATYPGAPKNPRTVIDAPEGSDLPSVVVGNITPDDWRQRIESSMSPEEIQETAQWYKIVFGEFQKQADGDPEEIARLTDAWFAGQQNSSPSQTLNDVLFVYEQVKNGVPKDKLRGKGLPSANKIVIDILTESEITGGAGQKIADFLDSGYGKNVRSIMGNDPNGGSPFVVDIHTARDTGLVDQAYINHLKRLGYSVPDNLIVDVGGGGIKGAQYESRALFGQELTSNLNAQKWMGRDDWEAAEIQAIGWMQLSNMYGGSNTGGDIVDAFTRNTRRISMEVEPGSGSPWATKFGDDFGSLTANDQRDINDEVTAKAIELVNKQTGITLGNVVHGTGGWELWQNPSTVQQAIVSKDTAIQAGARLGYLLQQTEVWVNAPKEITKNPKHFSIDIVEANGEQLRNSEKLTELFDAIIAEEPNELFRGYQPILIDGKPGIRILITHDAVKASPLTKAKAVEYIQEFSNTKLNEITDRLQFDAEIDIMEADLTRLRNNWEEDKQGGGYKSYFSGQSSKDASTEKSVDGILDSDGQELEKLFKQRIDEAKQRSGTD
jgi:hypothetical protein